MQIFRSIKVLAKKIILKFLRHNDTKHGLVLNINLDPTKKQKKVLICYVGAHFERDVSKNNFHANELSSAHIIKVFIDLNFCIDFIGYNQTLPKLDRDYDIIFGLGKSYREACYKLNAHFKILFLTEMPPHFLKESIKQRYDYFKARGHKLISKCARSIYYKEEDFSTSDVIIFKSPKRYTELIDVFAKKRYFITNNGLFNHNINLNHKNFKVARNNFVWFGSAGAIHKGLDLCIDVFWKLPQYNLHIYGLLESDRHILTNPLPNNIKIYPHIKVSSQEYLDKVVNTSAFTIFPSCSEAIASGVITGMLHGLIPIVTSEAGIVEADFVVTLKSFFIERIEEVIQEVTQYPTDKLRLMQKDNFNYAQKHYTLNKFGVEFREIIEDIL